MPGELGNEEEQQSVGYYEKRYKNPDLKLEKQDDKISQTSVLRVLRDYGSEGWIYVRFKWKVSRY